MSRRTAAAAAVLLAAAFAANPAAAQEDASRVGIAPRQVISIQPVHAILGFYAGEYERAVAPTTTLGVTGAYFNWEGESRYASAEGLLRYYPSGDALDGLAFGMTLGPTRVVDRTTYYYTDFPSGPTLADVVPPGETVVREEFTAIGFGFLAQPHPGGGPAFPLVVRRRRQAVDPDRGRGRQRRDGAAHGAALGGVLVLDCGR